MLSLAIFILLFCASVAFIFDLDGRHKKQTAALNQRYEQQCQQNQQRLTQQCRQNRQRLMDMLSAMMRMQTERVSSPVQARLSDDLFFRYRRVTTSAAAKQAENDTADVTVHFLLPGCTELHVKAALESCGLYVLRVDVAAGVASASAELRAIAKAATCLTWILHISSPSSSTVSAVAAAAGVVPS